MNTEHTKRDMTIILLSSVCIILISFNIVLLQKSYFQNRALQREREKLAGQRAEMQKAGFEEIARWQAELSAWPEAEQALEFFLQKEYERACVCFTNAIQKYSENPVFYYLRGLSYQALNKEAEAIQDFTAYLTQATSSVDALWKRALLYHKQKKNDLAIADIEKLLLRNPEHTEAKDLLKNLKEPTTKK
ncbi:MAG: tetratricopeptide repeat protein [Candidatus Brocadiae bacterium]|nr:tetratricopeptide repeat protein [Candidatus Brocadiia bacterium]